MTDKVLVKVWSGDRSNKKSITSSCNVSEVIAKASEKLGITGRKLVFEKDGTEIEDDEVLRFAVHNDHPLILLRNEERWQPAVGGVAQRASEESVAPDRMQQYLQALQLHERAESRQMIGNLIGGGLAIGGQLAAMYLTRDRPGPAYVPMFLPSPEVAPHFMLGRNRNRNNALDYDWNGNGSW